MRRRGRGAWGGKKNDAREQTTSGAGWTIFSSLARVSFHTLQLDPSPTSHNCSGHCAQSCLTAQLLSADGRGVVSQGRR